MNALDVAYLAIGADAAWRESCDWSERYQSLIDLGQEIVIGEVVAHAANLEKAWPGSAQWDGGVWAYDVAEELGEWIVRQWVATGNKPDDVAIDARIVQLITESRRL